MKILLCTPYKNGPDIVRGGINQWAQNILSYHEDHNDGIVLIPVSFDRHISLIHSNNSFQRFINGVREQINPLREAIKILKNTKPDVIHICTSAGMGCLRDFLLVKVAKRYHTKSIIHLHFGRLPELAIKQNWEWCILKNVLRQSDVIIPMNKPTEKALHENGFENVCYLPNPLNDSIIKQVSNLEGSILREAGRILFVGHVYDTKGVYELVKGCKDIKGVKLIIVGKCTKEMKDDLLSNGTSTINKEWIDFVGEIPHEEVIKEFLKADIFVFPSYTEGFPNVILESMACGCPIVASDVGAIPEMLDIDKEPCGICIKPQSDKEVYDAVVSLFNDSKKKQLFAERAKQRVNSLYAIPVVWQELVKIWEVG